MKIPSIAKRIFAPLILVSLLATASAEKLKTSFDHPEGKDVIIHVDYDGSIQNWDGSIRYDPKSGTLKTINNVFLKVTDAKGVELKPKVDPKSGDAMLLRLGTNSQETAAFKTEIPLNKIFDLSKPGRYTVTWGCDGEIRSIEVEIK